MSVGRSAAGIVVPVELLRRGVGPVHLGVLFAASGLFAALLSSVIGLTADRLGYKPFIVWVPIATALSALVFALDRSLVVEAAAVVVGSFGRGAGAGGNVVGPYQPAEQALITGLVPAGGRARCTG
ncbi:MAG: hypothetical protein ACYCXA_09205 [Actinomycetes bacterium]